MPPDQSSIEPDHAPIVVALEHLELLKKATEDLGIERTVERTSYDLGLALVRITNVRDAAQKVTAAIPPQSDANWPPRPPAREHLDTLLWALRRLFKHRYGGWTPTLGKNRDVDHVHGVWAIIHAADDPGKVEQAPDRGTRAHGPGAGVRVGVLDTGLYPQTWLGGGWEGRYSDVLSPQTVPTMAQGHATFIAGLILGQAPGAQVVVRQVLDKNGSSDSWTAAEEIVRLGRSGVDIINLSFACYTDDNDPPLVLATAIDRLDPNIVVVAAVGNTTRRDKDGNVVKMGNRPAWPAALDDVIAVGAATLDGKPADFSSAGPWVDLLARGVALISTFPDTVRDRDGKEQTFGGWAEWRGTSFASALIAGAIAAGTVPGRVPAATAARDLLKLRRRGQQGYGPDGPTFVPLRTE